MDINQLRYFLEVCRFGNISQASKHLYMSQQGVSRSLIKLEHELNTTLFVRHAGGLSLTETGTMLKEEAEIIIKRADYITDYCAKHNKKANHISISCSSGIIARLPSSAQQLLFHQSSNDFLIDLVETNTTECENQILDETVNLGIIWGDCDPEKFNSQRLIDLHQVIIVNNSSPLFNLEQVSIRDLHGYPSIVPPPKTRHGRLIRNAFSKAGLELRIVFECGRSREVIEMVEKNPGVLGYILTDDIKYVDKKKCSIISLTDFDMPTPICFVTKKEHSLTLSEKLFRKLLVDHCRVLSF